MSSEEKKNNKPQDWNKVLIALMVGVLAWNSWSIFEVRSIASKVDKYNLGVVDEMGKMLGNVKMFGEDLGEIRRFLLLPEKNYFSDTAEDQTAGTEEKTNSETSLAAFALLDSLVKEKRFTENTAAAKPVFESLLTNQNFQAKLAAAQLKVGEKGDLQFKLMDGQKVFGETQQNVWFDQPLYNLVFAPEDNSFKVQSALGEVAFKDYAAPDFSVKLAEYFSANIPAVRQKKGDDKKAEDEKILQAEQGSKAELEAKKKELSDILSDKAFLETLGSIGLKVAEKPREENNKFIYDIIDVGGKVRLSMALEISSGMIKVIQGNQETDTRSFLESTGSKKKP